MLGAVSAVPACRRDVIRAVDAKERQALSCKL
jgi:hypothetical protein